MKKIDRLSTLLDVILKFSLHSVRGNKEKAFEVLFDDLLKLGGIYVKFLQLIILNGDFSGHQYSFLKDSLRVFDRVDISPIDLDKVLADDLGLNISQLSNISTQPIAAGSFAQVYSANVGQNEVIVKVLRPEIRENLSFDLRLLGLATRVISIFKSKDLINYRSVFEELRQVTIQETDYQKEVDNATLMYEKYKGDKLMVIPYTFHDLCSANLIVQERLVGIPLTEYMQSDDTKKAWITDTYNTDLAAAMEKMAYEYLSSNLRGEVSHGDPHPGNIFLMPGGRIGLIDFGIAGKEIGNRQSVIQLLKQYVRMYDNDFDVHGFTESMLGFFVPDLMDSLSIVSDSLDIDIRSKMMNSLGAIGQNSISSGRQSRIAQDMIQEQKPLKLFSDVLNSGNRFSLKANVDATVIMRSTKIFLDLVSHLGLSKTVVRNAFVQVVEEFEEADVELATYDAQTLDRSIHKIADWLDRLRYSDPISYLKLVKAIE